MQSMLIIMRRRLLHGEKDVCTKLSQRDYKLHIAMRAVSRSIPRRHHKSVHLTQEGHKAVYFEDNIPGDPTDTRSRTIK